MSLKGTVFMQSFCSFEVLHLLIKFGTLIYITRISIKKIPRIFSSWQKYYPKSKKMKMVCDAWAPFSSWNTINVAWRYSSVGKNMCTLFLPEFIENALWSFLGTLCNRNGRVSILSQFRYRISKHIAEWQKNFYLLIYCSNIRSSNATRQNDLCL